MRLVNFFLLLTLIAYGAYQWKEEAELELSGSRWSCNELSSNFTSDAYKKYQEIGERDTIYFASSSHLTIYQSGELVFKNGNREKYEVIMDVSYKVKKNKLSLFYKNIDWHKKPESAPIFVRDTESLEGLEADVKFMIDDDQLYFFNRKSNEDNNFICFSV
ncbi:hypothetical protein PVK64_18840 [Aliivibrio sp. S4TY2]|uniref:hypothetical protein n=1 Tax=unclassified Aliivibrio TaxID=2645654 RepID=UPI002379D9CE|nr:MULTISPECIES: hypothetical protein [unclassified Aliivibrio]MDD9158223.1 hypothetical protein [Aliivibrio sp. S4TY2]MDD9162138.1 hypothetical protein [Aliivibrio sp. S4TY1]MDD9166176.1 hypothetical protein [Aliivibrio sp. S4MY2]MDD9170174.1 hypothetical protein [Aliivibrio sp. S4MY4]MDD9187225.1 hypothetical protein [Aliivibrio sp. S4MY3]